MFIYVVCMLILTKIITGSPWAPPQTIISCSSGEIVVTGSTASSSLSLLWQSEDTAPSLLVGIPKSGESLDGCSILSAPDNQNKWLALVQRGGRCLLAAKVQFAIQSGASAIVVVNTKAALYNTTDQKLLNPCWTNCDVARADSLQECEQHTVGIQCAQTPRLGPGNEFCAIEDKLIDMYLGPQQLSIPAIFVDIVDGEMLFQRAFSNQETTCKIYKRPVLFVDYSVFVLMFIGCAAVGIGSFRASWDDRLKARGISSIAEATGRLDHLDLSAASVLTFLCTTTIVIVLLFFIIQLVPFLVVLIIQIVFVFGSSGAMSQLCFQPSIRYVFGDVWSDGLILLKCGGQITRDELFGFLLGSSVAWTWFACRHEDWAWILLNILALSLSAMFLLTVRLPSLRVGTLLLCGFFFYDIFMVFISPVFSGGKSIMVNVATAGKGSEKPENEVCIRILTERLPILFQVPRFDWQGGYSMFGLGDVVLPGLLVALGLRLDYSLLIMSWSPLKSYWIALMIAYFCGLVLTFVANIEGWNFGTDVKGQPALMYLVPFCLGTFILKAVRQGHFSLAWNGGWNYEDEVAEEVENSHQQVIVNDGGDNDMEENDRENLGRVPLFT